MTMGSCLLEARRRPNAQYPHNNKKAVQGKVQQSTCSVHPLCEVVAGLQRSINLLCVHRFVLGEVLGVLPLEEFDAILRHCLASEVAVGSTLLILGLSKCKRNSDGTWTAIKLDLDDICDIRRCQCSLLSAIGLDKQ